jgi:UDP-N-acetylglucosamine enolpyruvyl transferase
VIPHNVPKMRDVKTMKLVKDTGMRGNFKNNNHQVIANTRRIERLSRTLQLGENDCGKDSD